MELKPGLISRNTKKEEFISPLRDSILVKMLDDISKDQSFKIDGIKKGRERQLAKEVIFEKKLRICRFFVYL